MDTLEAMRVRHAVRDYSDRPIETDVLVALGQAIDEANAVSGLNIQLVQNSEDALAGCPTHYGRFKNVHAMMALIGEDDAVSGEGDGVDDVALGAGAGAGTGTGTGTDTLDERIGYWGERLVLTAVALGLDTSWVVLHDTDKPDCPWSLKNGERMAAAVTVGYGNRPGRPHRSKPLEELGAVESTTGEAKSLADAPEWFRHGIEAVALAPSALGKQPVRFTLLADGRSVKAEALEGLQAPMCLGIAKLHFELGAGSDRFSWA